MSEGRAGFDVRHTKVGRAGAENRGNILKESMRELDEGWARYHAGKNDSIVPEDTHLNMAYVNDGQGGFKRATNIDEVVEYGDARLKKVRRKTTDETNFISQFVAHYPKSLCNELKGFYPGRVGKNGKVGQRRPRYVAKDPEQVKAYFDDVVDYLRHNILSDPNGIHGFDINMDETTPHIQVLADCFGPDPKGEPGDLRTDFSRIWTTHPNVRDDEGKVISGAAKMRAHQAGLREHLVSRGWPVEMEASGRSRERLSKASFQKVSDDQAGIDAQRAEIQGLLATYNERVDEFRKAEDELSQDEAELSRGQKKLAEDREDVAAREAAVARREQEAAEALRSAEEREKAAREAQKAAMARELAAIEEQEALHAGAREEIGKLVGSLESSELLGAAQAGLVAWSNKTLEMRNGPRKSLAELYRRDEFVRDYVARNGDQTYAERMAQRKKPVVVPEHLRLQNESMRRRSPGDGLSL